MDPVAYILSLVEQGKSVDDAFSHATQRYGLSRAELETRIRIARKDAVALLAATVDLI